MKKLLAIVLALMLLALPTLVLADGELAMGSWRTDDTEQVGGRYHVDRDHQRTDSKNNWSWKLIDFEDFKERIKDFNL